MNNRKLKIARILEKHPSTRDNDIELIYTYLVQSGLPTDLKELKKLHFNIFESIRRARQELQQVNPMLQGKKTTYRNRKKNEEEVRRLIRSVKEGVFAKSLPTENMHRRRTVISHR